jgi:hypothetical protein
MDSLYVGILVEYEQGFEPTCTYRPFHNFSLSRSHQSSVIHARIEACVPSQSFKLGVKFYWTEVCVSCV